MNADSWVLDEALLAAWYMVPLLSLPPAPGLRLQLRAPGSPCMAADLPLGFLYVFPQGLREHHAPQLSLSPLPLRTLG